MPRRQRQPRSGLHRVQSGGHFIRHLEGKCTERCALDGQQHTVFLHPPQGFQSAILLQGLHRRTCRLRVLERIREQKLLAFTTKKSETELSFLTAAADKSGGLALWSSTTRLI